jgi:hypothetical protein
MYSLETLYAVKLHISIPNSTAASYAVIVHLIFFSVTTIWGAVALAVYAWGRGIMSVMTWHAEPLLAIPLDSLRSAQLIASNRATRQGTILVDEFWKKLCEALVGTEQGCLAGDDRANVFASVTQFTVDQLSVLPSFLRLQLAVGLSAFRFYVLLTNLKPFTLIPLERRCALIEEWAGAPISITRKLFRPLRSLTLLAYFENPIVRANLSKTIDGRNGANSDQSTSLSKIDTIKEKV